MIKLSIIIATYNRAAYIPRTLKSLASQSLDPALWEIVIINNNSSDNTLEVCNDFRSTNQQLNIAIVSELAQGLSHARNCGLRNAKGEYIVIVDDDEEFNQTFLQSYYDLFESDHNAMAAGGKVIPRYDFSTPRWLSPYAERPIAGNVDFGNKNGFFPPNRYPTGGNMAFRSEAFRRYGVFNPDLGRKGNSLMGGEEKDLFQRLRAAGIIIHYVAGAEMYHIIPQSRVTKEYIYKVGRMIGYSERMRTLNVSRTRFASRLFAEAVKWGGTLVLWGIYTLKLRPSAGNVLIGMRIRITLGLLSRKKT